jgi:hypothetical protein
LACSFPNFALNSSNTSSALCFSIWSQHLFKSS